MTDCIRRSSFMSQGSTISVSFESLRMSLQSQWWTRQVRSDFLMLCQLGRRPASTLRPLAIAADGRYRTAPKVIHEVHFNGREGEHVMSGLMSADDIVLQAEAAAVAATGPDEKALQIDYDALREKFRKA